MIATHNIKVNGRWVKAGEEYELEVLAKEKPVEAEPAEEKPAEEPVEETPVAEEPEQEKTAEEEKPAPKTSTRRKKISG